MGTNTLTDYSSTPVPQSVADRFDQYRNSFLVDLVPRNSSGVAEDLAGSLGSTIYTWSNLYTDEITIAGIPFDPSNRIDDANQIKSGATRTASSQPLFLQPDGATNEATILATTTDLSLVINTAAVTFSTDVTISALTVAPSTNNTCLVNDTNLSGQENTKYMHTITYDTEGSEITALDGKIAAFKISTEVFLARIDDTNKLLQVISRGFFFDSSDAVLDRVAISNNDTITLLQAGWVYADNSGTSASVGYTEPTYSGTEPTSGVTNDYWFDLTNEQWKRYSGSSWVNVNRIFIGWVAIDSSNCIAARSADFTKKYDSLNTITVKKSTDSTVDSVSSYENKISIYGNEFDINSRIAWDMATDLESGVIEANDTTYYFYITDDGEPKISDRQPNYRAELRGLYHPFHTWRWVGTVANDSSGDLEVADRSWNNGIEIITTTDVWNIPQWASSFEIEIVGGGGAGGISQYAQNSGIINLNQGGTSGNYANVIFNLNGDSALRSYLLTIGAGGVGSAGGDTSFGTLLVMGGGTEPGGSGITDNANPSTTLTIDSSLEVIRKSYGAIGTRGSDGVSGQYPDFAPIGGASPFQFGNLTAVSTDGFGYGAGGNRSGDGADGVIIIRYEPIK